MANESYGSGGWKKWIWVYLVVAVVVYGLIYYFYANNKTDSGSTTGQGGSIYAP